MAWKLECRVGEDRPSCMQWADEDGQPAGPFPPVNACDSTVAAKTAKQTLNTAKPLRRQPLTCKAPAVSDAGYGVLVRSA